MSQKRERYTIADIIDALDKTQGYVSKAADYLGCTTKTIYNYRDRHEDVAQAWSDIRERRHDFVEDRLMHRIKSDDTTAIIFYLKTQCKPRGYIERQEVAHSGDASITVNWDDGANDND